MSLEIKDNDYIPIKSIPLRSPLAIGGFFLHFLRVRFSDPEVEWKWNEDDTQTCLFILSGGVIENELRNTRPAIYVNVGQMRNSNIVVGDKYDEGIGGLVPMRVDREASYSRIDMNITINVESSSKGEAQGLGWIVFSSLIAAQDVVRHKYQFSNMGPFNMNPPVPSKADTELFVVSITFGLSYELTSSVTAVQTFMKELDLRLELQSNSTIAYYTNIYLNSI